VFGLLLLDLVEDASKQFNISDRPPDIGVPVCHPTPIVTNWFVLQTINIELVGQAVKKNRKQRQAWLVEDHPGD
jgi:hypothetical protein